MMNKLAKSNSLTRNEIQHLRIDMMHDRGWNQSDNFYYDDSHNIRSLPMLRRVDILLHESIAHPWTDFVKERYWGACPRDDVRIVDARTGEWIDAQTSGPYQGCLDTNGGEHKDHVREIDYGLQWEEADGEDRSEVMMEMKDPLPRM